MRHCVLSMHPCLLTPCCCTVFVHCCPRGRCWCWLRQVGLLLLLQGCKETVVSCWRLVGPSRKLATTRCDTSSCRGAPATALIPANGGRVRLEQCPCSWPSLDLVRW